jgi:hypothetical protein
VGGVYVVVRPVLVGFSARLRKARGRARKSRGSVKGIAPPPQE